MSFVKCKHIKGDGNTAHTHLFSKSVETEKIKIAKLPKVITKVCLLLDCTPSTISGQKATET